MKIVTHTRSCFYGFVNVMSVVLWLADDEDSDTKTSTVVTQQQTTGKNDASPVSHVTSSCTALGTGTFYSCFVTVLYHFGRHES